jgi:hypothetical protein
MLLAALTNGYQYRGLVIDGCRIFLAEGSLGPCGDGFLTPLAVTVLCLLRLMIGLRMPHSECQSCVLQKLAEEELR